MDDIQNKYKRRSKRYKAKWRCANLLVLALVSFSGYASKVVQLPYLKGGETREYAYVLWQTNPGAATSIQLLPTVNATGRTEYASNQYSGLAKHSEVRNLPSALHNAVAHLVSHAGFQISHKEASWKLQFVLYDYQTLYALDDRDHAASLGLGQIDRVWSQWAGDNKASRVKLALVLYDHLGHQQLTVPVAASMMPCERGATPMVYGPGPEQQFLNGFATTTTGQTFAAAVNRSMVELVQFFADQPIRGSVLKVDRNEVYVSLGKGTVYPKEVLQLQYQQDAALPPYTVGHLAVEEVFDDVAITHPIDLFAANIAAGDQVSIYKKLTQPVALPVSKRAVECQADDSRQEQTAE